VDGKVCPYKRIKGRHLVVMAVSPGQAGAEQLCHVLAVFLGGAEDKAGVLGEHLCHQGAQLVRVKMAEISSLLRRR